MKMKTKFNEFQDGGFEEYTLDIDYDDDDICYRDSSGVATNEYYFDRPNWNMRKHKIAMLNKLRINYEN